MVVVVVIEAARVGPTMGEEVGSGGALRSLGAVDRLGAVDCLMVLRLMGAAWRGLEQR